MSARDWLIMTIGDRSVEEFLADCGIDANSSPEEIAKAAPAVADVDGVIVIGDIADAFTAIVDQAKPEDSPTSCPRVAAEDAPRCREQAHTGEVLQGRPRPRYQRRHHLQSGDGDRRSPIARRSN